MLDSVRIRILIQANALWVWWPICNSSFWKDEIESPKALASKTRCFISVSSGNSLEDLTTVNKLKKQMRVISNTSVFGVHMHTQTHILPPTLCAFMFIHKIHTPTAHKHEKMSGNFFFLKKKDQTEQLQKRSYKGLLCVC